MRLNLDCGHGYRPGWVNADDRTGMGADVVGDPLELLRVHGADVDELHAGRLLERLTGEDALALLRLCAARMPAGAVVSAEAASLAGLFERAGLVGVDAGVPPARGAPEPLVVSGRVPDQPPAQAGGARRRGRATATAHVVAAGAILPGDTADLLDEVTHLRTALETLEARHREVVARLLQGAEGAAAAVETLRQERDGAVLALRRIERSHSWRVAEGASGLARRLAPAGTRRRALVGRVLRAAGMLR